MHLVTQNLIHKFTCCVLSNFDYKRNYVDIKISLESYLENIVERYTLTGILEKEAVNKAIAECGNPIELGEQLAWLESLFWG